MPASPSSVSRHGTETAAASLTNAAEAALLLACFLLAAVFSMLPTARSLLFLWTSDPLRSFGCLLPPVSLALMVRAWHGSGWRLRPYFGGLVAIAVAVLASRLSQGLLLTYRIGNFSIDPFQPALLMYLFFSGVMLLLGGKLLWRRCAFPLLLLLCLNPVPHFFTIWVDYPLQGVSAQVARSFAHLCGLYPTGQQLQLMFTPKFGMEIIPGCNGLRGAATMAYLTMILCYLRRYRTWRIAVLVLAATLLGYLLNFVRLCLLVVYYAIGMNHPALRGDGALIDYIVGGCIFLTVSTLAGALWLGGKPQSSATPETRIAWPSLFQSSAIRCSVLLLLIASALELPAAYALCNGAGAGALLKSETVFAALPQQAGPWARESGFSTELDGGEPRWTWTTYRSSDGRTVDFGIWMAPFQHFALRSRQVHGIQPLWTGSMTALAQHGATVTTSDFVVHDDLGQTQAETGYFAETTCIARRCADHIAGFGPRGWSVAIGPSAVRSTQRLTLQFRIRHGDAAEITSAQRATDEAAIRDLVANLDTAALTSTLGFR